MSSVPMYFRDWWDDDLFENPRRTSRLFDQQFATGIFSEDLQKMASSFHTSNLRSSRLGSFRRPWSELGVGKFSHSLMNGGTLAPADRLQINLDVQQFTPHEITVKTVNNSIVVEGKHEEKQDEHGFISRHFVRRYVLPDEHDPKDVISSLSSDGVLTIVAPKKVLIPAPAEVVYERTVPIQRVEERTVESVRTTSESVTSESNGK
ncbi:protein lethal(2)essential for life-like [Anopheles maculipalpis]|uniref:protein lethal(2)essential for life-like n=1 Tax=Anopheles maculipalpis TaxID=1496333 RepID=UPI0021592171|nr:protein lethal(2)essential for life-like [Anopheles maculipalpis]